jgi:gluconokinase
MQESFRRDGDDLANSSSPTYYRYVKNGIYLVMGVAGSGKSLIGAALAKSLDVEFIEGDNFHPPANVRRMASGISLTDEDRAGWLAALAVEIRRAKQTSVGLVVACSALKRSYRDVLRGAAPDLQFIFLRGQPELIAERLANRTGHYMPASLLGSQLVTLETPTGDEGVWTVDIARSPAEIVAELVTRISK